MSDNPTDAQIEREYRERMDNMPPEDILRRAQNALIKNLAAKAEAGTISHQEMGVLRGLLKDNGLVLAPSGGEDNLPRPDVPQDLPTFDPPDYD